MRRNGDRRGDEFDAGVRRRCLSEGCGRARPVSVAWYERLAWAEIAVSLASSVANPAAIVKNYNKYQVGFLLAFAVSLVVRLLWIWLVARKRKNWARWISLVVVLIAIPTAIWDFEERVRQLPAVAAVLYYAAIALWMISVFLLFRRDAREWFVGRPLVPDLAAEFE